MKSNLRSFILDRLLDVGSFPGLASRSCQHRQYSFLNMLIKYLSTMICASPRHHTYLKQMTAGNALKRSKCLKSNDNKHCNFKPPIFVFDTSNNSVESFIDLNPLLLYLENKSSLNLDFVHYAVKFIGFCMSFIDTMFVS